MGKIVVGCWDCDYCGADRISGEIKICPKCGKPRGKDITFYMAGPKKYVEDPDKINKNPDWLCPYCNTLNPDDNKFCSACGAAREESEDNYFESKEKDRERKEKREADKREAQAAATSSAQPSGGGKSKLPLVIGILAVLAVLVFMMMPKTKGLYVDAKIWERTISIERYQETEDSGWELPDGAWNERSREEVYTYNQVLDHYETRTREVSEEVLDGYDTEVEYRDLGNGYYEEVEHQVPRYRTEYYTETYEEPVYVNVPVYRRKYYYSIMKWLYDRDEVTSGIDSEPYYAELDLPETERESGRKEEYWIESGDKTYRISYDLWQQVKTGEEIKGTVKGDEIVGLK